MQAAEHPPLYIVLLAAESCIGLHTYTRPPGAVTCLHGHVTIVIIGYTARELFGKGAGIFAAVIVAIYPYFWFNDGGVLSEGTAQLTTALTVLCAYRFWQRRTVGSACWLGVGIALATLSRAEAILLPVLMMVPMVLWMKKMAWKRRITLILASGLTTVVVLGAVGRLQPVALRQAGDGQQRLRRHPAVGQLPDHVLRARSAATGPQSASSTSRASTATCRCRPQIYRKDALDLHQGPRERELPMLTLAREGRTWGWYRPGQNVQLDSSIETKPLNWGRFGLVMLYSLEIASIFGVFVMRRRKIPVTPLIALIVNVVISTALTFGQSRYRASAEVALVLMATAGFAGLLGDHRTPPGTRRTGR